MFLEHVLFLQARPVSLSGAFPMFLNHLHHNCRMVNDLQPPLRTHTGDEDMGSVSTA